MAFSLRVSASFRFPLYGMHGVSATRPTGHESFFQASIGEKIFYVHFRDVRGTAESFAETFHDNGPTDMAEVMQALRSVGFRGPMRPDHVPQLVGEESGEPGYTMLGRLFAYGYIRGLMHATDTNR